VREFSVPATASVATPANLSDIVWEHADQFPDHVAFCRRTGGAWIDVTAREFRDEVSALAKGLIASGVEAGDRVGLLSRTRYEWTLLDYAVWAAGAVTVPVYETSSAEQVSWNLGDSGAVAVVVEGAAHQATVDSVRHDLPALRDVWQIDADGSGSLVALAARGTEVVDDVLRARRHAATADSLATIIYTSGTTGRPKGCELTHRNIAFTVLNASGGLAGLFNPEGATLLFLPLAHVFARLIQAGAVINRTRLGHTGDIAHLVDDLAALRPTFVLAVPRVFEKIYNVARQRAHAEGKGAIFDRADRVAVAYSRSVDAGRASLWLRAQHSVFDRLVYARLRAAMGGRCRSAISGGAPLGERLGHFYRGIGLTVYEGYGLTETSAGSCLNLEGAVKIGTVGRPVPGVSVRIDDDGEVLLRGETVFRGYWHDGAATAAAFTADGWFRTGDLGELDDDGYLHITGRKKELIVTAGGKNVAPAGLEDRLRAHPLVSQCMVVGDAQPFIACLVTIDADAFPAWKERHSKPAGASPGDLSTDPDLLADIQQAVDDANRAVSRAEGIKKFRILAEDFTEAGGEMTPSLKLKRNVVLARYADEVAAIFA